MPKRIRKPPSKKGGNFGNYLKKGSELGALGAVQFVPGLDVAADAAVAGEAALTAGEERKISNYSNPQGGQPPSQTQYRTPYPPQMPYSPRYREPMMPPQVGAGYREPYYPPPKKPLLGPLEKKIIIYGVIFLIIGIIVIVIIRTLAHSIDGYYHSSTGCHCKKHNHCGSGKKHNCNSGSNTKNSGHNSCGGS